MYSRGDKVRLTKEFEGMPPCETTYLGVDETMEHRCVIRWSDGWSGEDFNDETFFGEQCWSVPIEYIEKVD